jgi:hypothetical protein
MQNIVNRYIERFAITRVFSDFTYGKDEIEEEEMGAAYRTNREEKSIYICEKAEKRPLERPGRKWLYNIKMDFQEIVGSGLD